VKIGIVVSVIRESGGIYQYTLSILKALHHSPGHDEFVIFAWPDNSISFEEFIGPKVTVTTIPREVLTRNEDLIPHFTGDGLDLCRAGVNVRARNFFLNHSIDLIIYPTSSSFAFECGIPYIMAIPDLQHRLQPEFPEVSAGGVWRGREYLFRNSIRYAQGILADSEVGKEDVLSIYGDYISKDSVYALPFLPAYSSGTLNISDDQKDAVRKKYALPERYIFYPAQFWLHKNHARIVHAIHMLKVRKKTDIPLVLVGSHVGIKPEGREIVFQNTLSLAGQLGVTDLIHYPGYVPDEDMPPLYSMATLLVMPTFFGPTNIPIIEAWAFGCPVLTSDIRGVREQVGEAGLLVDPRSADAIADGILRLWQDNGLRQSLIDAGQKKINTYTINDFSRILFTAITEAGERKNEPVSPAEGKQVEIVSEIDKINSLLAGRKYDEAISSLEEALQKYPDSPDLLNLHAILKLHMKDSEGAKGILFDLIKNLPAYYPAYLNLACVFWNDGDTEDAAKYFEEALRISNYDRAVVLAYGEMLMSYKKYTHAKDVFERYLRMNPHDSEANSLLQKCEGVLGKVNKLSQAIGKIK
jgi:glycosyltransferase involved in cell wall biosynthesis/Flp pilus assembly protein TadD